MKNENIINAFPKILENEILILLEKINLKADFKPTGSFPVKVNEESLEIPYRIYFEEPNITQLTANESLILNCLFTRHHNGFVRQKRLKHILSHNEFWIVPFVVQLLGEYVIEILLMIEKQLTDSLLNNLVCFIKENPKFYETTKRRIVSYWDCYYRSQFPVKEHYVGFRILDKIEKNLTNAFGESA